MKTYNKNKQLIGAFTIIQSKGKPFSLKKFKRSFIANQNRFGVDVSTPFKGISGGWNFTDFDDRIRRYLKSQVKAGILVETKVGNRAYWFAPKGF